MNKAQRILSHMTEEDRRIVISIIGDISDEADLSEQAQYINRLLDCAHEKSIPTVDTMEKCGGDCLEKAVVETAKQLHTQCSDLQEFLNELNKIGIGGDLRISNGKIIATYKECYCDIPHAIKRLNSRYCNCSAGWFRQFFTAVFGKNVIVKIVDTIANGANECVFEISIEGENK